MNPWPDLRPILRGIPWVIVRGVATRAYMPERVTKDLDILIHNRDSADVLERLRAAGYRSPSSSAKSGFLARSSDGIEIDVVLGDFPWLDKALAHPHQGPAGYPVLALPYLVLMRMASFRVQDTADATRMLGLSSDEELDRVRAVAAEYAPEEIEDLESLIYLGQLEMGGTRSPKGDE